MREKGLPFGRPFYKSSILRGKILVSIMVDMKLPVIGSGLFLGEYETTDNSFSN